MFKEQKDSQYGAKQTGQVLRDELSPPKIRLLSSQSLEFWNVTEFGNKAFKEVIKLK